MEFQALVGPFKSQGSIKHSPNINGSHSLYVMCCSIAPTIFLASWYSLSSSHWEFNKANWDTIRLCSLIQRVCITVSCGCSLALASPEKKPRASLWKNLRFEGAKRGPTPISAIVSNDGSLDGPFWAFWLRTSPHKSKVVNAPGEREGVTLGSSAKAPEALLRWKVHHFELL